MRYVQLLQNKRIKGKKLRQNDDLKELLKVQGDPFYNLGLMKRYPDPLNNMQLQFVTRFKGNTVFKTKIEEYMENDETLHRNIVAKVNKYNDEVRQLKEL